MSNHEEVIETLKSVRDKLAKVYKDEVSDEYPDNGNLIHLHQAIINVENALKSIAKRG